MCPFAHPLHTTSLRARSIAIMARGRLRCLGTSLRLKARFGSGYRVSIRLAGADADASAGGLADAYGSSAGSAAANLLFEGSEIQPAPQQQAQQQRRDSPSGDSAAGRDLHLRDAATAAQAAAVRGLFMAQLGIKPSEHSAASGEQRMLPLPVLLPTPHAAPIPPVPTRCPPADESSAYLHFLVRYEHEERLPALFARLKVRGAGWSVWGAWFRVPAGRVHTPCGRLHASAAAGQAGTKTGSQAAATPASHTGCPLLPPHSLLAGGRGCAGRGRRAAAADAAGRGLPHGGTQGVCVGSTCPRLVAAPRMHPA